MELKKRNRIIVLIDFSEYSENLINFAVRIAEIIKAKVLFVHQISGLAPAMADREARNKILKNEIVVASNNLQKLARGAYFGADSFYVSRKPVLTTLQELKSEGYFDWVFTGLTGAGVLKRIFMGSTTISIVDHSDSLIVAVPVQTEVPVPKKILVGINPRYELNKQQLENVLSMLRDQITELEFFTILEENESETEAENILTSLQTEYKSFSPGMQLYKGKNAFVLLKNQVKHSEDSFLIVQQGSRSLRDHLFRKFMINELVYNALTPLIVLSS
jgi:nucleotide-binding universal stress UspA family protein